MQNFAKLPKECDFVCISDWDDQLYQEALSWVDDSKRAALISDRKRDIDDPRVQIYFADSLLQQKIMMRQIAWSAVTKKMHVIGNSSFEEELKLYHLAAFTTLSEAADYWTCPMKNARLNGTFSPKRGLGLKGAFRGIPALIVGAGPSLLENGHMIEKFQNKALIFAAGTALNVIETEPHFGGFLDPRAPYRQFKMHPFSELPFCYQSRMNPDHFHLLHGERLCFPDSSCGAINWIQGEEEVFDGGWTVGNFLTEIAILMGCSPIFFIGMDFCYEKGQKYAKIEGVLSAEMIQEGDFFTQRDWLMAAKWTEEREAHMFDMSRGLLKMPKIEPHAALKMCKTQENLRAFVHQQMQNLPLKKKDRWEEWDASFLRCQQQKQIEGEIVYQKLLEPLWKIWMPIFDQKGQDLKLHQKLFFERVLKEHEAIVLQKR